VYHHQIVQFGFDTRKLDTVLVSDLKGGEPFSSLPHAFRLGLVTRVFTLWVWYHHGTIQILALLNTGMNLRFTKCYKPSRVSFVTSSEKLIHTVNQQRCGTFTKNAIGQSAV